MTQKEINELMEESTELPIGVSQMICNEVATDGKKGIPYSIIIWTIILLAALAFTLC